MSLQLYHTMMMNDFEKFKEIIKTNKEIVNEQIEFGGEMISILEISYYYIHTNIKNEKYFKYLIEYSDVIIGPILLEKLCAAYIMRYFAVDINILNNIYLLETKEIGKKLFLNHLTLLIDNYKDDLSKPAIQYILSNILNNYGYESIMEELREEIYFVLESIEMIISENLFTPK